jgi:hypothetical protein
MLAEDMGRFFSDPLGFVMYAYDWTNDKTLHIVELVEPYATKYSSKFGPDAWACEFLEDLGARVKKNAFNGRSAVDAVRMATSSGHGIGKSAITAWLVDWIMSTRPHAKGIVTANTAPQLATKTWAEIAKWTRKCITSEWFEVTTGRGAMRMYHKQHPESWQCNAQTCDEHNSESFAGLHAANSSPFYIFDEASAIPAAISEVAEGGLTDGEPFFFKFGNPTRNSGDFHNCFHGMRHRWVTRQIDSRSVAITNKALIAQWVKDYGEDSDFVKVRVRGVFPSLSSLQFIPRDIVDAARKREMPITTIAHRTAVVGVDVARFGDDESVIRTRIGRDARSWAPMRFREVDTMTLASHVSQHIALLKSTGLHVMTFVDGGGVGGGVVDRLRQIGHDVTEVQFGGKAEEARKYANKRAEIWGRMREWLSGGYIEDDERITIDLTSVEYSFTSSDQIQLEKKVDMKKRGLASPDDGDALAITFAQHIPEFTDYGEGLANPRRAKEYDPYA